MYFLLLGMRLLRLVFVHALSCAVIDKTATAIPSIQASRKQAPIQCGLCCYSSVLVSMQMRALYTTHS
jgi:hypothetical protein